MTKENGRKSLPNVKIRQGTMGDFDDLLELLIKFYSEYETLSVHLKNDADAMTELHKVRLKDYITDGACAVAEIDGKVEGVFMGRIKHRHVKYVADYLDLPDGFKIIEDLAIQLEEQVFWSRIPPKFNTACCMDYGIVKPTAQGFGIGDKLLKKACNLCLEKGIYVVSSASLTEKTANWMLERGFAVMHELPLDRMKDKNGRSYFEGRPEKMTTFLVAFLDGTTTFVKSKM